tara:strand:- start:1598 stop:2020 length:423 start_codon:yes stop_codon:yes gene_type:complete
MDGEKADPLNTATFRDERESSMRRNRLAGNRHLRMIPEVRDHGEKLLENPTIEEDSHSTSPTSASNAYSATKLIGMLETATMSRRELDQLRQMVSENDGHVGAAPLDLMTLAFLFILGTVVGSIATFCTLRCAHVTMDGR